MLKKRPKISKQIKLEELKEAAKMLPSEKLDIAISLSSLFYDLKKKPIIEGKYGKFKAKS